MSLSRLIFIAAGAGILATVLGLHGTAAGAVYLLALGAGSHS